MQQRVLHHLVQQDLLVLEDVLERALNEFEYLKLAGNFEIRNGARFKYTFEQYSVTMQ